MNRVRVASYAALALVVVAVVIVLTSGSSTGYKVTAEFRDVDGLRQGSTVKIDGVAAGIVSKLVVTPHSTAMATLTLDKGTGPIGQGASIQVRPTDLLGERYAQLNLGNQNKPLPSGSFIPMARTSAPVDLDDVLDMLNADTRERLRILINEAGVALAGRGADFNQLLAELPPNITQAGQLLNQVASENTSLENLITEGDQVTAAVNGKRDDMGQAIDVADRALNSVALKQAQLGQTIENAPGALAELHTTLNDVGTASQSITPAAASLQQAAAPLTKTLRELPSFAASAQATLQTAKQIAPQVTKLGTQAQAPLAALKPTAGDLQSIAQAAVPVLNEENARGMRDLLWFVENWALGLKGRDALGHFIGADLEIDNSVLQNAIDSYLNNTGLSSALHRSKKAPAVHAAGTAPTGAPTSAPAPTAKPSPLSGIGKALGGLTSGVSTVLKGAAGSVSGTLGGVVKGLTGGGSSAPAPTTPSSNPANGLSHLLNFLVGK
ncbi:MAG TPA: MlaD family protein [Solirubrobacteraceae bacterium]|nr:MlaD family protein [Solirubrobacteraceae bacterium]